MEHKIQNTKLPPTISEIKKQQMNQNKRKDAYSEKKKKNRGLKCVKDIRRLTKKNKHQVRFRARNLTEKKMKKAERT